MTAPEPISIWQPRAVAGALVFQRPPPGVYGDHYADCLDLHPKQPGDPPRICFFGESAAAGYLLAPHVTPAKTLQLHLRQLVGNAAPEVIDLARTNERLATLVETVRASFQLSPDLLIIYAGNNWNLLETPELSPYYPSSAGRQRLADALSAGGFEALAELSLRERLSRAWGALSEIADLARGRGVPVALVVPEVNLADWETVQPAPWLPGDRLARWYQQLDAARAALRQCEYSVAFRAATAMLDLDGGVSPTPYRLLADAYAGLGNWPAARAAAEAEVVSGHYGTLAFLSAPQASTAEQRLLRRSAVSFGFATVDLPALFAGDGLDALPGRHLFMDYCHLTVEGVQRAAAAIAVTALSALGYADPPAVREAQRVLPRPEIAPEALATAQFGAAIHTAHRLADFLRKEELVRYWLRQALDTSPAIAQTMLDVIAARSVDLPTLFTSAQQRNLASPYPLQLQHGWKYDHVDACLVQAVIEVLGERDAGLAAQATATLLECVPAAADLVQPRYFWEPLAQFFPALMPTTERHGWAFLRVPWPVARFAWVTDGGRDLHLDVTARLPHCKRGCAEVRVNRQQAAELSLTTEWSRQTLHIPARLLRPGLNEIAFNFPPPDPQSDPWSLVIDKLARSMEADLFPVFGEFYNVVAAYRP